MKRIFLLVFILSQFIVVFAQKSWGPWKSSSCFKGIQFRVNRDSYNDNAKKWHWSIEIKNTYNKKVSISYKLTTPEDGEKRTNSRTTIEVGGVSTGDWSLLASNGNYIQIYVDRACFHHPNGFDQCSEYDQKGYASFAECDNGTPKYTVYSGSKSGNSNSTNSNNSNNNSNTTEPTENNTNNNNNTTTTPQNDPTFDRNNASFQDYYKRAMTAKDAGNYNQAETYLNSAISVAVNDAQKDNARQWLAVVQNAKRSSANNNNSTSTTTQQTKQQQKAETLTQVSNALNDFASSLEKMKQEKREKEKQERAEKNRIASENYNNKLAQEKSLELIDIMKNGPENNLNGVIQVFESYGYKYDKVVYSSLHSLNDTKEYNFFGGIFDGKMIFKLSPNPNSGIRIMGIPDNTEEMQNKLWAIGSYLDFSQKNVLVIYPYRIR